VAEREQEHRAQAEQPVQAVAWHAVVAVVAAAP